MDKDSSCCCGVMPATWWWMLTLLGLPLLFMLMLAATQGGVESDLASRSVADFKAAGMDWVKVTLAGRGRDLLLQGSAASTEDRDKAIKIARNVYGVREVQSQISVPASDTAMQGADVLAQSSAEPVVGSDSNTNDVQAQQAADVAAQPVAESADVSACRMQLEDAMSSKTIPFATGKIAIEPESIPLLNTLAGIISSCKSVLGGQSILIGGHTDNAGNEAFNLNLSQQRADAVKDYFVKDGIDAGLLKSVGYGASRPVASNDTENGRAQNRRITIEISPE